MSDLGSEYNAEFVDVLLQDIGKDEPGGFTRIAMISGPPMGVNPNRPEVVDAIKQCADKWPHIEVSDQWVDA
jgi:hypothetical protein